MPPKKNGKAVRVAKDEESGTVALREAGALPPSPDEDGQVERDVDIMSEAPEPEDTSRVEEVPNRCEQNKHLVGCSLIALFFAITTLVLAVLLLATSHPKCTVANFFDVFNASHTHCV